MYMDEPTVNFSERCDAETIKKQLCMIFMAAAEAVVAIEFDRA